MRRRLLVVSFVLAAGFTGAGRALADPGSVVAVDLPLHGARSLAVTPRDERFTLVGIHWRGRGRVVFRTRRADGRWSAWHPAAPEEDDGPDPGSPEARASRGWRLGSPWWVGFSDRVEARAVGAVTAARAYLVWSPPVEIPMRVPTATSQPTIVPRASWGADESIRRAPPTYAPALRLAIVHHTAGANDYTRAQAPAIVRAIELYHVKANGWNDIGYNFLVDRFGTVYEGRYGGVDKNVIGAHALGFNTGSTGIAVLGTYGGSAPSQAAQDALARLLAWRLDLAHVDPLGTVTYVSGGSDRFAAGIPVALRVVSGHRDTGLTECPGDALYARLPAIARAAARIGLPKLYDPRVEKNAEDGSVRFRARLSSALPWTVSVTDASGTEVARGSGSGKTVDWTWDAASAPVGGYMWSISAGSTTGGSARPATGSLRAGAAQAALAVGGLLADPETVSPNGDGQADVSLLSFDLSTAATVSVTVSDSGGTVVDTPVARRRMGAGEQYLVLDASTLADGAYTAVVTAQSSRGEVVESTTPITVNRVLGAVTATPYVFSPNGDGRLDTLDLAFSLAAPAQVTVRIEGGGRTVGTLFAGNLPAGPQDLEWDGQTTGGRLLDGFYEAVVEASDDVGTTSYGVSFVSDTSPPRVRIVSLSPLRIAVSEPASLRLLLNGARVTRHVRQAGVTAVPWRAPVRRVQVVAQDWAGNVSAPVSSG